MARHVAARRGQGAEEGALPSQRLVEAALVGDDNQVEECLATASGSTAVDVNYVGTVSLRAKCAETVLLKEAPDEVRIGYEEFRTDVTALFAAAHSGHAEVVRLLLAAGVNVNLKLFWGYAISAAAREGHCDILDMILKAGASEEACEDALLQASQYNEVEAVQLLISSEMARTNAAAHALVTASYRGFIDVVSTLVENGVDVNCMSRVLLRSTKPVLHANVDCTPLVAAVVSRQVSIVKYLLEVGARTDCLVKVSAWTWDPITGEELRVGAGLGEPCTAAWCAVEYYEATGEILKLLLENDPSLLEDPHLGRTLLCHAILCQNVNAVCVLLDAGANTKFPIITENGYEMRLIHLAARVGYVQVLRQLISVGSEVNARTSTGESPVMLSANANHEDCFLVLLLAGADLGLVSNSGDSAMYLARRSAFASSMTRIFSNVLNAGACINSTDLCVFSPLHFVAESGTAELLQMILHLSTVDLNKLDGSGLTPLMVAAKAEHIEAFRLLVMAGADITLITPDRKTLMTIIHHEVAPTTRDCLEQILLNAVLANIITDPVSFRALHFAARKGDSASLVQLLKMGHSVDSLDEDGYSPLMLAAMEGHSEACKILLLQGDADCSLINHRSETALSLARQSSRSNKVTEGVLLDHLSRLHVLTGEELYKHTREGRGTPHIKVVRMLESGVLTWGKTTRRNIACKEATAGPSLSFSKNRRLKGEDEKKLIFRVVADSGREVHFEASSAHYLELWVHGINLIAKEASSSGV